MELQHHQSGGLPVNGSALNTPSVGTPLDGPSTQHRAVLQERSANWPHDSIPSPLSGAPHTSQKLSRSQSPTENAYPQQATAAANYFTGSLHAQHIGLAGCAVERSEKQIVRETKRLYALLQRSEKYQKYREKQPVLTRLEFIEREEREAKMKVEKDNKSPEKSVWPEFLEHAFWRALIRWPPMGRKKFMLDGALRGRNELIQDSIYKDTRIRRDRKQVSSHLQVLKQHLKDQPGVLVYMATKDEDKKRHRGREASNSYHLSHLSGRHHQQQRVGSGSKYDYSPSTPFWTGLSSLHSSLGLSLGGATGVVPYAVTDFTMLVENGDQPVHDFTKLSQDGRQQDLHVTDTAVWNRQYPEFAFLQKQATEWSRKNQKVLLCDASIKIMTETRPNAQLSITFDLHSQRDLQQFDSLVCTTRFFDDGKMNADPQFDGPHHNDLKEHRTSCEYTPDPHGCTGILRLAFGSRFWVNRMSKYQSLRHKDDNLVGRSLMKLTATQDVYGVSPNGAAECILTILWRFRQTRDSAEVGAMRWRAVSFGSPQSGLKQEWTKQDSVNDISDELLTIATSQPQHSSNSVYHQQADLSQLTHLPYAVQHYPPQPPQLHIDTLSSWSCTAPDLTTPSASAAPSTATDHSFASLPNLSHSQDTAPGFDANDFDFTGGRIDITGAFSPAIMAQYDAFTQSGDLSSINALAGMDHQSLLDMGLSAHDIASIGVAPSQSLDPSLGQLGAGAGAASVQSCYSTKPLPSWTHNNTALISSLESQAESGSYVSPWTGRVQNHSHHHHHQQGNHQHHHQQQQQQQQQSHSQMNHLASYADDLVGHGSLHSSAANLTPNMWNLASPFHEDTGSGAAHMGSLLSMSGHVNGVNVMERKDSMQAAGLGVSSVGLGVLDLIERDQRARGY